MLVFGDSLPKVARFSATIPAAPGRKERAAQLVLRFLPVTVCRPHPSPAPDLPDTIGLTMVDVREVWSTHDGKPIHWRLLTTRVLTTRTKHVGSSISTESVGPSRSSSARSRPRVLISRKPTSANPR